jgi:prolipoprotein diacylglyceryltransferase
MFGLYLSLNGAERLLIECMRVNRPYSILGIRSTQAQFIAALLIISGAIMMWLAHMKYKKTILENIEP